MKKYESHGEARTRLYAIYCGMKSRCYDPGWRLYGHYGARGISVCDEWRESYLVFRDWALSNGYADNLTIDRIDGAGNYTPENCRWIPQAEQKQNRSICRMYKGVCLAEYCRNNCIPYNRVMHRLHKGWTLTDAIEVPAGKRRNAPPV